jgi:hypothetical protein
MGLVGVVDLWIENPVCGWSGAGEMVAFSIVAGLAGSLVRPPLLSLMQARADG